MNAQDNKEASVERQREHFDSIAERYQSGRKEKNHILLKELIWHSALSPVAAKRDGPLKVLEPMCGAGEGGDIVRRHFGDAIAYEGFDYSGNMVAQAKAERPDAQIWQADATTFEPAPNEYDIIILIGGLHHIPNAAAGAVLRLTRGLKPSGMFINFEPTSGNLVFTAVRDIIYRRNTIFDENTERAFSASELKSMFRDAGLTEKRTIYPGLLAYVMYYNPYAFPLLNIGGERMVKGVYAFDRLFQSSAIGRFFSFATLTIWEKPPEV